MYTTILKTALTIGVNLAAEKALKILLGRKG